jgi:hypothetical protein
MLDDSAAMLRVSRAITPRASDIDETPSANEKFLSTNEQKLHDRIKGIALAVEAQPEEFAATPQEVQELCEASEAFSSAFMKASGGGTRSMVATEVKDKARDHAKKVVTRLRERLRHVEDLSPVARVVLKLRERAGKPKPAELPKAPPKLRWVRALHEANAASPMHELEFREFHSDSRSRPSGAARLELFVDLIPPDEPIPNHPGITNG